MQGFVRLDRCANNAMFADYLQSFQVCLNLFWMTFAEWEQRAKDEERRKAYHKTSICRAWKDGVCRRGQKCSFAHGYLDLSDKGVDRLEGRTWYTDPVSGEKLYLDGHGKWWKHRDDGSKKLMIAQS